MQLPCVDSLPGAAACCGAQRGGGPTVYILSIVSISIFSEEVRTRQGLIVFDDALL